MVTMDTVATRPRLKVVSGKPTARDKNQIAHLSSKPTCAPHRAVEKVLMKIVFPKDLPALTLHKTVHETCNSRVWK